MLAEFLLKVYLSSYKKNQDQKSLPLLYLRSSAAASVTCYPVGDSHGLLDACVKLDPPPKKPIPSK